MRSRPICTSTDLPEQQQENFNLLRKALCDKENHGTYDVLTVPGAACFIKSGETQLLVAWWLPGPRSQTGNMPLKETSPPQSSKASSSGPVCRPTSLLNHFTTTHLDARRVVLQVDLQIQFVSKEGLREASLAPARFRCVDPCLVRNMWHSSV